MCAVDARKKSDPKTHETVAAMISELQKSYTPLHT
jgi:hypothetical protein